MPLSKDDFQTIRWTRTINLTLQILLGFTLLLALNSIAANHFVRKDITQNRHHSLSPETIAYLSHLEKNVDIFVTIPPISLQHNNNEIYQHIAALLKEYTYATRNNTQGKINLEFIDPYKQNSKAQEIANRFGTPQENAIIISSENKHRQIVGNELYDFKQGEIIAFKGEHAFTSAILDVSKQQQDVVYFLTGHGEMRFNDVDPLRGLSQATQTLLNHNLNILQLNLSQEPQVPKNANLVIIPAPQAPLLPYESQKLRHYLNNNNGSLILLLEPGNKHGLDDLLYEWGIQADDMVVMDRGKDCQSNTGDLIIKTFAQHPITQFLIDYELAILSGLSIPVRPNPASPLNPQQKVLTLITGSPSSWGIHDFSNPKKTSINPDYDLPGPVPIATLSERNANSQLGISIPGGRVLVFGNSDFITNHHLSSLGNRILFQNSIQWCLERSELLNIPPRPLEKFQLPLSQDDVMHISLGLSLIPTIIGALGLFIYSIRRH